MQYNWLIYYWFIFLFLLSSLFFFSLSPLSSFLHLHLMCIHFPLLFPLLPLKVPPGHMVQQIVDENGTLRHIILSALNNNGTNTSNTTPPAATLVPQQQAYPYCCCCCYCSTSNFFSRDLLRYRINHIVLSIFFITIYYLFGYSIMITKQENLLLCFINMAVNLTITSPSSSS